MSGPSTELELQVLEALEVPRSVGDILFLRSALQEAGRESVDAAMASLSSLGLVVQVGDGRLWSLTEDGERLLSESAEWQIRCDRVDTVADGYFSVGGIVERGLVKVGDWWHDGRGATGPVVEVESWDAASSAVAIRVDPSDPLVLPLVMRRWERMAGSGEISSLLQPPEWNAADWASDLFLDRSLPDIAARFAGGRSWDDVHASVLQSGLRWEYSKGALAAEAMPPASDVFADKDGALSLLKVWVGQLQFNAHYFDAGEVEFDVEIDVLGDGAKFECLVAFMDWVAAVAGTEAVMTHEGSAGLEIRSAESSVDYMTAMDAVRLADLRNPVFGHYRGVIAPRARLDERNVDSWLEKHGDPDLTSGVLSHVHMYDVIESVDDEVTLARLAQQVAQRWREALPEQFPDRQFVVGVDGEPDEYGPTVWMQTSKIAASGVGLSSEQRERVRALAAERLVGGFSPEGAVRLAADLLAGGIEDPAVLALAILPADANELRRGDVEPMFDELCVAVGVRLAAPGEAGWVRARSLATAIVDGDLAPGVGASHLWPLWEDCGLVPGSDPLDMLQLSEEWESSVGAQRQEAERRILASARSVVRDADRALAAMQMPNGFTTGTIRAVDVMPLLLEACPSFLPVWYEIEDEHRDPQNHGGRLCYLDAGDFARHVVEMHRSNHRRWLQNAFDIIERMHIEGDEYVRELATIGYLEDIENMAGHAGVDPAVFEEYLGPESRRWWEGLEAFWSGQSPRVVPTDRRKTLRHWLRSKLPSQVVNRSRFERQTGRPE